MKYGIELGACGACGDPRTLAQLARLAEEAGWDGLFLEDYIVHWSGGATYDPWICLAAMAVSTEKIRLGTTVTPLARRRPWKVARETMTLLYEWEILFSRLPAGEPAFIKLPVRTTAEVWPAWEPLTPEAMQKMTNLYLTTMVQVPAIFHSGEWHSAIFQLDRMRLELIQMMYRRLNIGYSSRYKHFSEFMPPAWKQQFLETYVQGDVTALEPAALARGYIRVLELWGEHLPVLGEQAGGGFQAEWFTRIQAQVIAQLGAFAQ